MTLLELQRRMAGAIMAPLGPGDRLAKSAHAAEFIKPNSRLTADDRLQIYARGYWYRILDSLYDDFPGLRAILGSRAWDKLARAYLTELPSQSFTLRDLGSRLPAWLQAHPDYAGNNPALAFDMVRLEWACVVAFDGPAEKMLGPEDLIELSPSMSLRLQPYITLLALEYPVDDLHIRASEMAEGHGEASNAVLRQKERRAVRRFSASRQPVHLAVHRVDDSVYFRPLDADEFRVLEALSAGTPIGEAIENAFQDSELAVEEMQTRVQDWFASWAEFGWFCR